MKLRTERNVHGANFSWQNSLKVNPERTHQQMLSYYDENRIFPIEAILKHKQVVCMRRKMPLTIFKYLFSFRS